MQKTVIITYCNVLS